MNNAQCVKVVSLSTGGAFGGGMELEIDREKALVDPFPFFRSFMYARDRLFDYPNGVARFEEKRRMVRMSTTLFEFAEAFFGAFPPEHMARYFRKILEPGKKADALLGQIDNFEWLNLVAIVLEHPGFTWMNAAAAPNFYQASNTRDLACLYPLGDLKVSRLNELLRPHVPRKFHRMKETLGKFDSGGYKGRREDVHDGDPNRMSMLFPFTWFGYNPNNPPRCSRRTPRYLREALLQSSPQVVLYNPMEPKFDPLDDVSMIQEFRGEIKTDHLKIVRE